MSADLLREAAALMRARAEIATPGPWSSRRGPGEHVMAGGIEGFMVAETVRRDDRRHIASWHPAVALTVADWLDAEALAAVEDDNGVHTAALKVALTYLGRADA